MKLISISFCWTKNKAETRKSGEGYSYNIGFCNIGAEAIPISIGKLLGCGSGRSFSIIFCTLFVHLFFNWAAVPGGRFSNPPTSQSPIVVRQAILKLKPYNDK
jgi:hypothetical protein